VLNGTIAEDSWFGDEVTPGLFRDELMKCDGNIMVWIFANENEEKQAEGIEAMLFSRRAVTNSFMDKFMAQSKAILPAVPDNRVSADALRSRLNLIVH
jgi:ATP-dependent Clp protease protease subunit